ncbi:hypothetical protein [Fontivita pretiosa]|uniref:hypothetical protein n=1 Tax=Fontivita pretiosa TaxID=2989684 RepID=UPI003D180FA3
MRVRRSSRGQSIATWLVAAAAGAGLLWAARCALRRSSVRARPVTGSTGEDFAAFQRLRRAIIGSQKAMITAVFGPPHASAGFASMAPAMLMHSDAVRAATWYYPLRPPGGQRAVLVVQFDNDVARDATLVHPPSDRPDAIQPE